MIFLIQKITEGQKTMEAVCEFDRLFSRNVPHISEMMFLSLDLMSFMNCLEVCKSWHDLLISKPFKAMTKNIFFLEIHSQLIRASYEGNMDLIHKILSTFVVDINQILEKPGPRKTFFTSLGQASLMGQTDVVQLLLDRGADPNLVVGPPGLRRTSLHVAASKGHQNIVRLLLDKGANPNMADQVGRYPLIYAADPFPRYTSNHRHNEVAQLLLDKGADPNTAEQGGIAPLHWTVYRANKDLAKLLISKGADPNVADENGLVPLYWAVVGLEQRLDDLGLIETQVILDAKEEYKDMIQLLLDNGADKNMADPDGRTPLVYAEDREYLDIANILRDHNYKNST